MAGNRQQQRQNFVVVVARQLGWPLLWGLSLSVGFYTLLHQGFFAGWNLQRYVAAHPVEYTEVGMFFIGVAALTLKLINVVTQHLSLKHVVLPEAPPGGNRVEDAPGLISALAALPTSLQETYLVRRLREALTNLVRKGSADELDEHLRYLTDGDSIRAHDSYALVRLVVWAIPILGFLGTVIGITMALGNLAPESLAESTEALTRDLSVAFDTTTVALALSIVLMFSQFGIERVENELLSLVDEKSENELIGRFAQYGTGTDPHVASVRRMTEEVIRSVDKLVVRQAELWQKTIDAAHRQWTELSTTSTKQMEQALAGAFVSGAQAHAERLTQAELASSQRFEKIVEQLHGNLGRYAGAIEKQQTELSRQGEIMHRAVEASGRVTQLQKALNDNLQSLAGAKNFEDTVMSLSAAIHLLSTRLGGSTASDRIELEEAVRPKQGRAA